MKYWEAIVHEVLHQNDEDVKFSYTNLGDRRKQVNISVEKKRKSVPTPKQLYSMGGEYKSVFLTLREAQCGYYLKRGESVARVAKRLGLSPRTIEFYVKNMKLKVGALNKRDLLEILMRSPICEALVKEDAVVLGS